MVNTVRGFDALTRQTPATLTEMRAEGVRVAAFYLGGPHAAGTHLGTGYAAQLATHGYTILPVYVGRQAHDVPALASARHNLAHIDADEAKTLRNRLRIELSPLKTRPSILGIALDWEGEMSAEGADYCRAFLNDIPGRQYLYRTDAGTPTPERQVWLAHPNTTEADAIALLGQHPYGHVIGVQYLWGSIDADVFDASIIRRPPRLERLPRRQRRWVRKLNTAWGTDKRAIVNPADRQAVQLLEHNAAHRLELK